MQIDKVANTISCTVTRSTLQETISNLQHYSCKVITQQTLLLNNPSIMHELFWSPFPNYTNSTY